MAITLDISRCISPDASASRGGKHSRKHCPEEKFHRRTMPS